MRHFKQAVFAITAVVGLCLSVAASATSYTIYDQNAGTGTGFDNPTPEMPVGGNSGTTLGAQRRIALNYAVQIVLSRVADTVPINISATVDDTGKTLDCSADSGTLAYGGPADFAYGFSGAPSDRELYPAALANELAGRRLGGDPEAPDVRLEFNGQLDAGDQNCLQGTTWYYGLDGKPDPQQLDFVATAVHEMIHGLGFVSTVALTKRSDAAVGQFPAVVNGDRYPDVFSTFVQDLAMPGAPLFSDMTYEQRARALTDGPNVVWASSTTDSAAYGYLTSGLTQGRIQMYAPDPIAPGSSISHWSGDLSPNQIMQPYESPDVGVLSGIGLAACALQDIGWQLSGNTRCPDINAPTIADSNVTGGFASAQDTPTVSTEGMAGGSNGSNGSNESNGVNHSSSHGGGGGCTVDPHARFDPMWLAMLGVAVSVLIWRRRRAMG